MKKPPRPVLMMLVGSALIVLLILLMQPFQVYHYSDYISVLFPKGIIAYEERNLLFIIQAIMLLVVIPVYVLTFWFSWKYRAKNGNTNHTNEHYDPDLVDNVVFEYFWWGIPLVFTLIIAVLTWYKTYELDPYKPLVSDVKPKTIQVVAMQWKWLFIYPEEKIASLNFLQIPVKTPIHFEITADAPMNSFWIPHLGGQIYAMPKMKTDLHLIADETGDFRGSSANISGEGFADMHFITRASSEEDYQKWVNSARQSGKTIDFEEYEKLAKPSSKNPPQVFQLKDENLFNQVIMKFTHPKAG